MTLGPGSSFPLIVFAILAIGTLAGWLAGEITQGHGFGFWANASLGTLGALIGSWSLGWLEIYPFGRIAVVLKAIAGAVIVLAIAHWFQRRRQR